VKDAIDCLKQGFAADVVVSDLIMPEMDGFMFLEKMRDEHLADKAIKFALTNQSTDAEKQKVKDLGADGLIVKAMMIPSEVVNMVETAIAARHTA
jgi:CheY-like chemotaxis protein